MIKKDREKEKENSYIQDRRELHIFPEGEISWPKTRGGVPASVRAWGVTSAGMAKAR